MTQPATTKAPKRLDSLKSIRLEMARVYADARAGSVQTSDASKLTYCLGQIAGIVETEHIEKRIEALEKQVKP